MAEHIKMSAQEAKEKVAALRRIVLDTYEKEIKNHPFFQDLRAGTLSEDIQYFRVHEEADLSEEHGGANQLILQKALEEGYGNERAGWPLAYCARISVQMVTNFYDGVYRRCRRE